ncbi:MAG: HAD-IA family hydrolase [Alphaproteobacteria bacterium]
MAEPKLIVFDCDGTLVDSGHIIVATMHAAWDGLGIARPEPDDIRHQIGLPLLQAIRNLHPAGNPGVWDALVEGYKNAFVSGHEVTRDDEPLYENCVSVLTELSANETMILGVATGKGRRGLGHTLTRHDIAGHFSVLKTADDGPGKPNPDILLDAMGETGVSPLNTVMIGDTIFDMEMAVRAGAHAIGVSWGYHPPEQLTKAGARTVAGHFTEIPGLLKQIWSD